MPSQPIQQPAYALVENTKLRDARFSHWSGRSRFGSPRAVNKEEDLEEQDASRSSFRASAESSGIMTRVPAQRAPQKAPLSHAVRFAGPFALSDVHFIGFDA